MRDARPAWDGSSVEKSRLCVFDIGRGRGGEGVRYLQANGLQRIIAIDVGQVLVRLLGGHGLVCDLVSQVSSTLSLEGLD